MFDFVRTHQKLMQIVLAIVIVPMFVLGGVATKMGLGDSATTIARVADQPLTQQDWEQAQRSQLDAMRQQMGPRFDQKMFDTPEFKQDVLDTLIAERSLRAEIKRSHMGISEAALQAEIMRTLEGIPDIFTKEGRINGEVYRRVLANARGLTPAGFEATLRGDMVLRQLTGSVEGSGFAPRTVSKMVSEYFSQEREVQELALPISQFLPNIKVTDEMVKAFYDKNAKMFEVPEQAKIEYVVLNSAAVADQVSVSDEEIAAYYKGNEKRFTAPEARQASHILVAIKPGVDKAAAKAKAEAILADVRKNPADFAKIAKAKSDDPGSAERGGDLGIMEAGGFVKPVEDGLMKLKKGEISNLVESEYGFHILTITDLKASALKPLDEVKGEIAADLKKQKAGKKYTELAEAFSVTVNDQAGSLKPVADQLKLKIETADGLTRKPSPMLGAAPFNNEKFLKALFSDEVLKDKRNTDAIEVGPSTLIAGRIVEFKPASKRPLAEVEGPIRQRVAMEEAMKAAKKAGEEKLAAARKTGDAAGFGDAKILSRAKVEGFNQAAAVALMKADVSKLPAYVGVELPGMGYGVYRIGKVQQPAAVDAGAREADAERVNALVARQEMVGYLEALKHKAKVKIVRSLDSIKPQSVE